MSLELRRRRFAVVNPFLTDCYSPSLRLRRCSKALGWTIEWLKSKIRSPLPGYHHVNNPARSFGILGRGCFDNVTVGILSLHNPSGRIDQFFTS
jgi:hypothetical protein